MIKTKYILLVILPLLAGCNLIDDWSAGDIEVRRITINNDMVDIKVKNIFEITLIQDDSAYIDVICGENFQPKVDIHADGKSLIIDHSINNRWLRGYDKVKLEVHLTYIPTMNIYSPIKLETQGTFNTNTFYLVDWGSFTECNVSINVDKLIVQTSGDNFGEYNIKGTSRVTDIAVRGSTKIDCSGLQTESCNLYHKSIMDVSLTVSNNFVVNIISSGNAYYRGNPTVTLTRSGSGNIYQIN